MWTNYYYFQVIKSLLQLSRLAELSILGEKSNNLFYYKLKAPAVNIKMYTFLIAFMTISKTI